MANVYSGKGELDNALAYYNKSLTIRLKYFGENHQSVATSYNNMASACSNKGELDKALEYYHKSLVIRLKTIGENHPSVIISYINIIITWLMYTVIRRIFIAH